MMKLKASELRFGNYVKSGSNIFSITEIKKDSVTGVHNDCIFGRLYQHLEPIALTELWLRDFGFEKYKGVFRIELRKELYLRCSFNRDILGLVIDEYCFFGDKETVALNPIEYVHQLQNLYFALTNKELKKQ